MIIMSPFPLSSSGFVTPAYVNSASTPGDTNYSSSVSATLSVTAGNLIVVGIAFPTSSTSSSVSDSAGNTYHWQTDVLDTGTTYTNAAYAIASATGTITVTWYLTGSSNYRTLLVSQYSGSCTVFGSALSSSGSSGTVSSAAFSTTANNQLVVLTSCGLPASSANGGAVIRQGVNYGNLVDNIYATPATSTQISYVQSGSATWATYVMIFKAS